MHHNRTWPLDLILLRTQRNRILPVTGGVFELKAIFDTTTSTSLTWTESSPKPDTYRIERSTDGISFSTVTSAAADVFSYTDTGRTESTEYYYRIIPVLNAADQPASNIASTWTVPATPTGLTATAISSTQINLAWSDVSTGNTAQSIQRRSPAGSGSYSFIASVGATATSYSDTGLTLATQYEYQVAATNPATQSAWSTAANATTTGGGPPASSWTLDFSTGEPWSNGTNYVFSSTASTTRTYVNSSGYVAPCVANRWTNSEVIASWPTVTITNCNTAANSTTAPDGTTTADTVSATTTSASHWVRGQAAGAAAVSGANCTWSVYLKAGGGVGATYGLIAVESSGTPDRTTRVIYDLTTGARTQELSSNSPTGVESPAQAENCGNGWWRVWLRQDINGTSHQRCFVGLTNVSTSATLFPTFAGAASDADFIYVWGAQYVIGSAALPYSATTTSSNGIPRLTHNSSGSRLGLLVEGQRANLLQRSEEFDNAYWSKDGILAFGSGSTANAATAPDNTTTADLCTESSANAGHSLNSTTVNANRSGGVTCSVYAKKPSSNGRNHVSIGGQFTTLTNVHGIVIFDLTNGQYVAQSGFTALTLTSYGSEDVGNGWYRFWIVVTEGGAGTSAFSFRPGPAISTATSSYGRPLYAGNGTDGVLLWGAQVENAATPSSYIPTTTASITRQADIAYVETADVTNWGRPGSFVVEYYKPLEQSGGVVVADDDGAGNAGRLGVEYSAGGPRIVYGTSSAGAGGTDSAGLNKIGWAWDGSGAATRSALNGSALDTSLATSFDPTLTDGINLGGNIDWTSLPLTVSGQPNVVIRKVRFWNSQLSAADLNTLTT